MSNPKLQEVEILAKQFNTLTSLALFLLNLKRKVQQTFLKLGKCQTGLVATTANKIETIVVVTTVAAAMTTVAAMIAIATTAAVAIAGVVMTVVVTVAVVAVTAVGRLPIFSYPLVTPGRFYFTYKKLTMFFNQVNAQFT